jgi:hypothetical protein
MTPETCVELFGVEGEPQFFTEDFIFYDGVYYTDMTFGDAMMSIANWLGEVHDTKTPDYDWSVDRGYGYERHCAEQALDGKLIIDIDHIKGTTLKPLADFMKDYPKFNKKKFFEFYNELDAYYDHNNNN